MKIQINNEGKLIIDNVETDIKNLTVEVLEDIVDKSLNNEVEYVLDNPALPITQFFDKISRETSDGSDLKTKIAQIEATIAERETGIESISETYAEE